jgi:hypothetical protein
MTTDQAVVTRSSDEVLGDLSTIRRRREELLARRSQLRERQLILRRDQGRFVAGGTESQALTEARAELSKVTDEIDDIALALPELDAAAADLERELVVCQRADAQSAYVAARASFCEGAAKLETDLDTFVRRFIPEVDRVLAAEHALRRAANLASRAGVGDIEDDPVGAAVRASGLGHLSDPIVALREYSLHRETR